MTALPEENSRLRVAVGLPTCNRPRSLRRALDSLTTLQPPQGAHLLFIVVNNGEPSTETDTAVAGFAERTPWPVCYTRETVRGISHARNKILDSALESGARYLLGLDDDEVASPDWAGKMICGMRANHLDLAGGPMRRVAEPSLTLSRSQAWVLEAILEQTEQTRIRQETRARKAAPITAIYTCNFGLDLDFVRRTGIRYDPAFALSGGEDTDFARRLVQLNGSTGWIEDAHLTEVLPAVRLTKAYIVRRNRDFAPNWVRFKGEGRWPFAVGALEEALDLILFAIPAAFGGPRIKLFYLERYGRFLGHMHALIGRRKWHYSPQEDHLR